VEVREWQHFLSKWLGSGIECVFIHPIGLLLTMYSAVAHWMADMCSILDAVANHVVSLGILLERLDWEFSTVGSVGGAMVVGDTPEVRLGVTVGVSLTVGCRESEVIVLSSRP